VSEVEFEGTDNFCHGGLLDAGPLTSTVTDELVAARDEFIKPGDFGLWAGSGLRLHGLTVIGQGKSVDGVCFGEFTPCASEVAGLSRVDHTDNHLCVMEGGDEGFVVRPRRFTDDMNRRRTFAENFEQPSKPGWGIWDGGRQSEAGATQFDGILGNIRADVDRMSNHG